MLRSLPGKTMRFHVVVNPVAGRRRALRTSEAIAERLRAAGHDVDLHVTSASGDAGEHAATLTADALDRLVVAGGDGTLREILDARAGAVPWPVAVLPMGTANLVARESGFLRAARAGRLAEAVLGAEPWRVNLLEIAREGAASRWAVATVGVGLDAEVVHRVAEVRSLARTSGTGGYRRWLRPLADAVLGRDLPLVEATIDRRRTHYATAVVVQSAHAYGGLLCLVPAACLDADALHAVVVRSRARRDLPRLLLGAWRGRLARYRDVRVLRGQEVALRALRPAPVQADGDPAGTTDVVLRLRRNALTLLRAPDPKRRPP